jgi:glucosyltransferase
VAEKQMVQKILVYRRSLLPLSETFIKEQVLAYGRWRGILVGMRRARGGLDLDGLDHVLLRPDHPGVFDRFSWKVNGTLGSVPPHVRRRLGAQGASLLHAHFGTDAPDAWRLARAIGAPMLVTLHGYDINIHREWWEAGHGGQAMQDYPDRLLRLASEPAVRFIAVSEVIRRRAVAYGIPAEKVMVRHIGVDRVGFAPGGRPVAEREFRVLFVGRLVEKKGCEYLIRAFAQVQRQIPDASLVIAGDGDRCDDLRRLAGQLGVGVGFRGALSGAAVRQELHLARVFCLPSVTAANGDAEGLPIVLLEAQAAGVPVVTSAGDGEAVRDGVTGFTVGERDIDALAARITTILTNSELASAMSAAGPRFVAETFDIRHCTDALERCYDDTIEHGEYRRAG